MNLVRLSPNIAAGLLFLRILVLFGHWKRGVIGHSIQVLLWRDGFAFLHVRAQQLEVVDVVCRSVGVKELGLLVSWVAEGMRRSNGHRYVVAFFRVDNVLGAICLGEVIADGPLGCQEGLVVHFMPVSRRTLESRRKSELGRANAVIF